MTKLLERQSPSFHQEENMDQFLSEIRQFPRLTVEEERELAKKCAAGDEEAIRRMVNTNLRLVVSVAREYAGRGVSLLDLVQEGSIGLLKAARKFDHTLDYRFSTYATKWIRQGISGYLADQADMIRVPEHTAERIRKVQKTAARLRQEQDGEPSLADIAREMQISEEKVRQLLQLNPEVCSLDLPVGQGEGGTLGALIEDEESAQPQQELVRRELEHTMELLLQALDERQRQILRLHFGMEDGVCHSLEQISKRLGISRERVRQLEHQAMEKLQKLGADVGLEDFLE